MSPLFGDWPEDRAAIDRLALALDTAVPITPTEHLEAYDRGRYLRIRYRDGTELMVRGVARCEPRSDAKDSVGASCRGRWVHLSDTWWVEGTGMVKSAELGLWWEDMTTFMVSIGTVNSPERIKKGESFGVSVCCWGNVVQAPTITLSLVSADGPETKLAEIPVSSTYFQEDVVVPGQTPSITTTASRRDSWAFPASGGTPLLMRAPRSFVAPLDVLKPSQQLTWPEPLPGQHLPHHPAHLGARDLGHLFPPSPAAGSAETPRPAGTG